MSGPLVFATVMMLQWSVCVGSSLSSQADWTSVCRQVHQKTSQLVESSRCPVRRHTSWSVLTYWTGSWQHCPSVRDLRDQEWRHPHSRAVRISNHNLFSVTVTITKSFSALMLLVLQQEGHMVCKTAVEKTYKKLSCCYDSRSYCVRHTI